MSSMANLDVEISMDCLVVDIDRPWLHAELFVDAELDSGQFEISPGEATLKRMYDTGETPKGEFQQFTSYPTAFVVAADVELSVSLFPLTNDGSGVPYELIVPYPFDRLPSSRIADTELLVLR
jgi:hypothetical protein